jgi:hypothetical protein
VFVGGKIPSLKAKFTSSRGTTVKAFIWRAIEQKNPFTRGERRVKRQEQARATREAGELRRPAPRYVAVRAIVAPPFDPELARIIGEARTLAERRQERLAERARREQLSGCVLASERAPPE